MTNIIYRTSSTETPPTVSSVKGAELTMQEFDSNLKSISNDIDSKAPIANPIFDGQVKSQNLRDNNDWQYAQFQAYSMPTSTVDFTSIAFHVQDNLNAPQFGYQGDGDMFGQFSSTGDPLFTWSVGGIPNGLLKITNSEISAAAADTDYVSTTGLADAIATKATITSQTGSILMPSGTSAQRDSTPQYGATRVNSTITQPEWWNGVAWVSMGGGATGAGSDRVFVENDQVVTTSYTITAGKNASSAGPITINDGVVVTVPSGATWVIV